MESNYPTAENPTPKSVIIHTFSLCNPSHVMVRISSVPKYNNYLHNLIPSTCHYLNRYFGFEEKNLEKKPAFLQKHVPIIKATLHETKAQSCLGYFEQ
ncbi:MAG: hypothetical protein PVF82_07535 [Gammaproteobacteria bacterium]|jgi:hypothetical protein